MWLEADEVFRRRLLILSNNRHLADTGNSYREKIRRGHFVASRLFTDKRWVQSTSAVTSALTLNIIVSSSAELPTADGAAGFIAGFGERDELFFVARHGIEPAAGPLLLGLLNAFRPR